MSSTHAPCRAFQDLSLAHLSPWNPELMSRHDRSIEQLLLCKFRARLMNVLCRPVKALGLHPSITAVAHLAGIYGLGILMTLSAYAGYVVLAIILEVAELCEEYFHHAVACRFSLCIIIMFYASVLAPWKMQIQGALTL